MNHYLDKVVKTGEKLMGMLYGYDKELMPTWLIAQKHKRKIQAKINKEAKNKLPNIVLLIQLAKELEECDKMSDLACYELALLSIFKSGTKNKHIIEKLEGKINQLRASRDYEFNQS